MITAIYLGCYNLYFLLMIAAFSSLVFKDKSFLAKTTIFWCLFLFFINFAVDSTGNRFNIFFSSQSEASFQRTLDADLEHLVIQGDSVAMSTLLKKEIKSKDPYALLKILMEQKNFRNIPLLSVTDAEGFVLTRADPTLLRNDNLFLSTMIGRKVSTGVSVSGYMYTEKFTTPGQILMSTGRPVYEGKDMVGTLFSSRWVDNDYSKKIALSNKVPGVHVAFYAENYGILSTSFSNAKDVALLQRNFNTGSSWIKDGESGGIFNIDDTYYYVKNIILPTTDEETVGALLFIPIFMTERIALVLLLLLGGAAFTILTTRKYLKGGERDKALVLATISTIILATSLIVGIYSYITLSKNSISLVSYEHENAIYNSTLKFGPDSGVFDINNDQLVSVILDSGGELINVVGVDIDYNPAELDIINIDDSTSACDYIIEKNIDEAAGQINFSCALFRSLDHPQNTVIARLLVHSKTLGQASLQFASTTTVKAHDGLATEVLRMSTNASFTFVDKIETLVSRTQTKPWFHKEIVFSTSHPNSERWYQKNSIRLLWTMEKDEHFRYSITRNKPDLQLESKYTATTSNMLWVRNLEDGLHYFNLAEDNQGTLGGPITSYAFRIDTTPPENVRLIASQEDVRAGSVVRFMVEATDATSGLASGFYIKVNNYVLYPVKNIAYVPFMEPGEYKITARVFDRANNYTDVTKVIIVK